MSRFGSVVILLVALLLPASGAAATGPDGPHGPRFTPGAPGAGDPYFPLDGNGGYDVRLYDLAVTYDPATDLLTGTATIKARATQDLSAFNLDLDGLDVHSVAVQGRAATWSHAGAELTVTPDRGLRTGTWFRVVVQYSGVPRTLMTDFAPMGFIHTDDGAVVLGQPHVAATWFPVNDHPIDRALFRFAITVPDGLEAIANGELRGTETRDGWSTWSWRAREAMAPYLATMTIGEYDLRAYRAGGVRYWDAIDPDLFRVEPRTGEHAAYSGRGEPAYHRLTRTLTVPDDGGTVSFWVDRDTLAGVHFMAVEARPVGSDDWTTLRDVNGHTSADPGFACPFLFDAHPSLERYLTPLPDGAGCLPEGTTGEWWGATGVSDGAEQWMLDLGAYAGVEVEVSIAHITPGFGGFPGLVVDDVAVSWGEGTTSFEADADRLDGWTVGDPPAGSPPDPDGWVVGTLDEAPPAFGDVAEATFARQPEVVDFLEDLFGWYPFRTSGGVVVDHPELFFALETQTRPVYGKYLFAEPVLGASVVVHELAHQWVGDHLTLQGWQHIWLNEGFATYTEWLWREREGVGTAQEAFDSLAGIPAEDPFWTVVVGDPGPEHLLAGPVYDRGAMTLHALRLEVGDDAFFDILRTWVREQRGRHVTTGEFVEVAERVSGRELGALFDMWLFTGERPASLPELPPPHWEEEPHEPEPSVGSLRTTDGAPDGSTDAAAAAAAGAAADPLARLTGPGSLRP